MSPLLIGMPQILLIVVLLLIFILPNWFLYEKANQPGWASLIPIYSTLIWLRVIGKPWYWLILFLIPYVNLIFIIWATNLTAKSFGKSEGYTIGLILLPFIFYPILAFGSSTYVGPAGK
jgi:hypothetical protein